MMMVLALDVFMGVRNFCVFMLGGVLPHSQRHAVLRGLTGSMDRLLAVSMDHH